MGGRRRGQARYDASGTPSIGKRIPWQILTLLHMTLRRHGNDGGACYSF